MKELLSKIKNYFPLFNSRYKEYLKYGDNLGEPPGVYGSPVIALEEIIKRQETIFNPAKELKGIDLNAAEQFELIKSFKKYYDLLPYSTSQGKGLRYVYDNGYFPYFDAISLFGIIHHFKPRQIIEVGSGFSSAVMLDTNELFFNNSMELSFIEPYPQRLNSLLKKSDNTNLQVSFLQDVSLEMFTKLERNDILFVDTSHVVKVGSELNHVLFEILPLLRPGVIIHFHDIFYPFEYPKSWVLGEKRSWNEIYFLQSFLMYNSTFKILLFNSFLGHHHAEWLEKNMPLCMRNTGGSFWLVKEG